MIMDGTSIGHVSYQVTRFTIDADVDVQEFRSKYEAAVPNLPMSEVRSLVSKGAPWEDMLTLISSVAPFGFLIYGANDVTDVMSLAGDHGSCVFYLMGNHTIAERVYRYEPSAMLYAPLHIALWSGRDGLARLSFDRPSDQFSSFGQARIASVGVELDFKLANLLGHLNLPVPNELVAESERATT